MSELYKINYHLTEYCNFHCKFCFAKYEKEKLCFAEQMKVIKNISECGLFDAINFAGGEPLLDKNISSLIKYAKNLGLKVSIITNGYLLNDVLLNDILPYLDMIGISVQSANEERKIEIGCCTTNNKTLTNERLLEICKTIKEKKPSCLLKINSVVCSVNYDEELKSFIEKINNVDKWKCFKCQAFQNNKAMCVSKNEYERFKKNNDVKFTKQVFVEDMKSSYIMVNPSGELIKPSSNTYEVIGSLLKGDINSMIEELKLDMGEYERRYA